MQLRRLVVKNWRNFTKVDVPLSDRMFLVGPNASGKSNLLDVFVFMRDLAKSDGGLQQAVESRGTLKKLRSLFARRNSRVEIKTTIVDSENGVEWSYSIAIAQESRGLHRPIVAAEKVVKNGTVLFSRPDDSDKEDPELLTQTRLEQIGLNKDFRELAQLFQRTSYLHLIPQLLKFPSLANRNTNGMDPFGIQFLH